MSHMEENNFFTVHQHGVRKGRSCVTQLIEVVEKWSDELDNHNSIDAIYLDFQKAFDTIPHKRLIHKLKVKGMVYQETYSIGLRIFSMTENKESY